MESVLYVGTEDGVAVARSQDGHAWEVTARGVDGWDIPEVATVAGSPNSVVAGTRVFGYTTEPAATRAPAPIRAPSKTTALAPITASAPTEQPWRTAPWPMMHRRPTTTRPCTTTLSSTRLSSPMTIGAKSPRRTAPNQTLAPRLIVTRPTMYVPGVTNAEGWIRGR